MPSEERPTIANHDCATGVTTHREVTDEEWEALKVEWEALAAEQAIVHAEDEKRLADAEAGRAKLADLGLSADEIAALVG